MGCWCNLTVTDLSSHQVHLLSTFAEKEMTMNVSNWIDTVITETDESWDDYDDDDDDDDDD